MFARTRACKLNCVHVAVHLAHNERLIQTRVQGPKYSSTEQFETRVTTVFVFFFFYKLTDILRIHPYHYSCIWAFFADVQHQSGVYTSKDIKRKAAVEDAVSPLMTRGQVNQSTRLLFGMWFVRSGSAVNHVLLTFNSTIVSWQDMKEGHGEGPERWVLPVVFHWEHTNHTHSTRIICYIGKPGHGTRVNDIPPEVNKKSVMSCARNTPTLLPNRKLAPWFARVSWSSVSIAKAS